MRIVTECEHCGETFSPQTSRGRFCSDKCRVYFWREKKREEQRSLTFDSTRYQEEFDRLTKAIDMTLVCREFFGKLPEPHYQRYNEALTELYRAYFGLIRVSDQYAPYQAD